MVSGRGHDVPATNGLDRRPAGAHVRSAPADRRLPVRSQPTAGSRRPRLTSIAISRWLAVPSAAS